MGSNPVSTLVARAGQGPFTPTIGERARLTRALFIMRLQKPWQWLWALWGGETIVTISRLDLWPIRLTIERRDLEIAVNIGVREAG